MDVGLPSRRVLAGVVSTALALQVLLLAASAEVALAACTGRTPHDNAARQVNTSGSVSGITGISSSILEKDPVYTGYNSTGTFASDRLVSWSSGAQWAQLGWTKSKLHTGVAERDVFVEFYLSVPQNYWQFWPAKTVGTSTWYEILYGSPSTFDFYVAGTHYKTFTGSFTPSQYQVFGETHDWEDQMPGLISSHETFVNTQYFVGSTSYWVSSSLLYSSPFAGSHPSTGRYDIWDTACP